MGEIYETLIKGARRMTRRSLYFGFIMGCTIGILLTILFFLIYR